MSFSLDVSNFVKKAKKNNELVMRQVSIRLFSAIIKASPVDTGRFRMNWQTSGVTPASGVLSGTDPSGSNATSSAVSFVTGASNWYDFTLTNNLPYAQRLEFGWSKQAPSGVVRINVLRFNQLLNEEAAKVK